MLGIGIVSSSGFCALILAKFGGSLDADTEFEFYLARSGNPVYVHVQGFIFSFSLFKPFYNKLPIKSRKLSNR